MSNTTTAILAAALLGTSSASMATAGDTATKKPNIILIVSDDMGYNELNYMNETRGLMTPHIDSLAKQGVSFDNWYVQPICSPTRSALMTGLYPVHIGTQSSVIFWDTPWGVPLEDEFIPELLKKHSTYHTAMYGKWHLGMYEEDYCPWKRGFDEYLGYLQGCGSAYTHVSACCTAGSSDHDEQYICKAGKGEDYRAWDWFNGSSTKGYFPDFAANETNSAHLIRDATVDFLERMEAEVDPFFLYLPFQNIHGPYTCDEVYFDAYNNAHPKLSVPQQTIFGYITELDAMIGSIMAKLTSSSLYNNTWILFTSDNGAPPHPGVMGRNYPLRGHKASLWEGGLRVPGFVHSPLLPAAVQGTRSSELYHVTDLLPTIMELAGVTAAPTQHLDGSSILHSITTASPSPRTEMLVNINPLCSSPHDSQANAPRAGIRVGDMKLLVPCFTVKGINGSNVTGPVLDPPFKVTVPEGGDNGVPFAGPHSWPMLFNLTADKAEVHNLAPENPQLVAQLMDKLQAYAVSMVEPQQWDPPYQGPNYACAKCPKASGLGNPDKPSVPWINASNEL